MTFDPRDKPFDREAQLEAPYEVGYGKPPVKNQFKKGRSGNPRGRPRKAPAPKDDPPSLDADRYYRCILKEASRRVVVREGGREIKMEAFEAGVRLMINRALTGDRLALRDFEASLRRAISEIRAADALNGHTTDEQANQLELRREAREWLDDIFGEGSWAEANAGRNDESK